MAFKVLAILSCVTMAFAGVIPAPQVYHSAPVPTALVKSSGPYAPASYGVAHAQPILTQYDDEYDPHPQYKFGYEVQDALSGDTKSQVEERDGDVVRGEYSLVDADGFKRTVQYTVDADSGFNAVVNRVPLEHVQKVAITSHAAPAHIVKDYQSSAAYNHLH